MLLHHATVFHRLEAAWLVFRIKAAAASISNKSRAAFIWVFHFYLRRKKIGKKKLVFKKKLSKKARLVTHFCKFC